MWGLGGWGGSIYAFLFMQFFSVCIGRRLFAMAKKSAIRIRVIGVDGKESSTRTLRRWHNGVTNFGHCHSVQK